MSSVRVFTNLSAKQYAELTKWCVSNDRSISYAVSNAITAHLPGIVAPYSGEARIKVMSRTTHENSLAVKALGGVGWRWINAAVQEMLNCETHGS